MIVTDLSNSFNPVPKIKVEKKKEVTEIKKKSNKLAKLEKNRFSIITNNLDKCYFCNNKKMELHEAFRRKKQTKKHEMGISNTNMYRMSQKNNKR